MRIGSEGKNMKEYWSPFSYRLGVIIIPGAGTVKLITVVGSPLFVQISRGDLERTRQRR